MYSFIWLALFFFLFCCPALALLPKAALSGRTAIAIPMLSVLILYLAKELLYALVIYNTETFRGLLVFFGLLACIRTYSLRKNVSVQWQWTDAQIKCYLFSFLLLLPALLYLWLTPFDRAADAITSWEYWAHLHFAGERPDFFYTRAPYPQAFPVFMANIYTALGSASQHDFVRSLAIIAPFCLLTMLSLAFLEGGGTAKRACVFTALIYIAFYVRYFVMLTADPMMAASLSLSAFYAYLFIKENRLFYLLLASLLASLAVLTKQQAAVWSLLCLPLLVLYKNKAINIKIVFMVLLPFIAFSGWYFLEGTGVLDNQGVIHTSMKKRNLLQQLLHSLYSIFIVRPQLALFLLLPLFIIRKSQFNFVICIFFILPAVLLWLVFGGYAGLRLAIHVIAVTGMLVALNWDSIKSSLAFIFIGNIYSAKEIMVKKSKGQQKSLRSLYAVFIIVLMVFVLAIEISANYRQYPIGAGHRNTLQAIYSQFPEQVLEFYDNKEGRLFTHMALWKSIYYDQIEIVRPDSHNNDAQEILEILIEKDVDYIYPPFWKDFTELGNTIRKLVRKTCPDILSPHIPEFSYESYRINKSALEACRNTLMEEQP